MEVTWSPIGAGGKMIYFFTITNYSMEYDTSNGVIETHEDIKYGNGFMLPISRNVWNDKTKEICDKLNKIQKLKDKI